MYCMQLLYHCPGPELPVFMSAGGSTEALYLSVAVLFVATEFDFS